MLDFVPNHTAPDHPWVETHPDYYVAGQRGGAGGGAAKLSARRDRRGDRCILAHGRDPYFPGWPDTLQLNYANPATAGGA